MNQQELEIQITGSKVISVLMHAMATIEQLELTDAELDEIGAVLEKQVRDYDNSMLPMIDPTYYRQLMWTIDDIKMGLSRIALIREIKRHWQYDKERLEKMP